MTHGSLSAWGCRLCGRLVQMRHCDVFACLGVSVSFKTATVAVFAYPPAAGNLDGVKFLTVRNLPPSHLGVSGAPPAFVPCCSRSS